VVDWSSESVRAQLPTATAGLRYELWIMNVPVEPTGDWNRGARAERRRRKTSRPMAAESVWRMGTLTLATDSCSVGISDVDWRDGDGRRTSSATQLQLLGNNGRKVGRGSAVAGGQQHYFYENSCSPRRRAVKTERHRRQALPPRRTAVHSPPTHALLMLRSFARPHFCFHIAFSWNPVPERRSIELRADARWPTAYVRIPNAALVVCVIDRAAVPTKNNNIMFLQISN